MEIIYSAGIWLTVAVYKVAAFVFELFLVLATGKLLEQDTYKLLITNFYVVLGVIMLFVLAFTLLKVMVNPDEQKQSATTVRKIIVNIITSAIIMAVLPTIFSFAYDFQDSFILEQNTIGKFFGYGTIGSSSDSPTSSSNLQMVKQGAYQIVNGVYTAFFNVNMDYSECDNEASSEALKDCQEEVEAGSDTYDYGGITLETFADTMRAVEKTGSFGYYSAFAANVADKSVEFNFLLSLVGGVMLIYVGVSYCFDMALRLVKLVFYQLIAPIPIFFRIIPEGKMSGSFQQWMKITLACYMEVYIRIFIFYFCVFLCVNMMKADFLSDKIYSYGILIGILGKAFILMGIITFMKQAPKLFSEITGIDSGNMSLGIRDKLAAGGAFTAGAIIGGGATGFARNAVNAFKKDNVANKWKGFKEAEGFKAKSKAFLGAAGTTLGAGIKGIPSMVAGTVSAQARAGKAGWGAKSYGDMKSAAGSGAKGAVDARDKRSSYKAYHGGTIGAAWGHIKDTGRKVGEWAGIGVGDANLGYYTAAAQSTNSFNELSESTYKKKQEYMDQNSVVKALQSRVAVAKAAGNNEEVEKLQSQLDIEKAALIDMQRTMAAKKKDVISIAATRLSVDQHSKYSNDKRFVEAYEEAIYKGFDVTAADYGRSRIEEKIETIDGKQVTTKHRVFYDENKKAIKEFDSNTTQMFDAMLSGGEIKDEWINESNVVLIQEAIDKANVGRQHIKTEKERQHIVKTGNRSTEKKDN